MYGSAAVAARSPVHELHDVERVDRRGRFRRPVGVVGQSRDADVRDLAGAEIEFIEDLTRLDDATNAAVGRAEDGSQVSRVQVA